MRKPASSVLRQIARLVVALAVVGGVFWWDRSRPVDARVAFELPPVIPAAGGSFPREELTGLAADLRDDTGAYVAQIVLGFAGGLEGPLTRATPLRLPRGSYPVSARLTGRDGRASTRHGILRLEADGEARVSLD